MAAVARAVGVTSPALYRYFDGRSGLVQALYDDVTAELIRSVDAALRRQDAEDLSAQLHAAALAVFDWSIANPVEFDLLMGSGFSAAASTGKAIPHVIPRELGGVFGRLFVTLWRRGGLKYPADDELEPSLRRQITTYRETVCSEVPLGVAYLMITCWRQIYGLTAMAVYGHLGYAFGDHHDLFDDMIGDLLKLLGLTVSPNLR